MRLSIGEAGTSVYFQQSLLAGTQVAAGSGTQPLSVKGRFADRSINDPTSFWADDALSNGAFDLFDVHVSDNGSGGVKATVQLSSSPNPDFSLYFGLTADQFAGAIQSGNWIPTESGFVLGSDLSLIDFIVTNLNGDRFGDTATAGAQATATASDAASIPEPSTLAVVFVGISLLSICKCNRKWPRLRTDQRTR